MSYHWILSNWDFICTIKILQFESVSWLSVESKQSKYPIFLTKTEVLCENGEWRRYQGHDKQVWQVGQVWKARFSLMGEEDAFAP